MKKFGFSLIIEVLIIVTIIGVVAAIAEPAYSTYSSRSKIAMVANTMRAWQDSLLASYHRTGSAPATSTLGGTTIQEQVLIRRLTLVHTLLMPHTVEFATIIKAPLVLMERRLGSGRNLLSILLT